MDEKKYLFNPFRIKSVDNKDLQEMYEETFNQLIESPNSMYDYAHNIEVYSNMMYICGECIARFTRDIIELKTKIQIDTAVNQVQERNNWDMSNGKAPAISYFEALATRMSRDDINKLADKECFLNQNKHLWQTIVQDLSFYLNC